MHTDQDNVRRKRRDQARFRHARIRRKIMSRTLVVIVYIIAFVSVPPIILFSLIFLKSVFSILDDFNLQIVFYITAFFSAIAIFFLYRILKKRSNKWLAACAGGATSLVILFFVLQALVMSLSDESQRYMQRQSQPSVTRPQIGVLTPFPWPLPPASSTEVIRPAQLGDVQNLQEIADLLEVVLHRRDYEYRYYGIASGFVMLCRMERINDDATSAANPIRWTSSNREPWSIWDPRAILRGLFNAPYGHYRIIAFAVTDVPLSQEGDDITSEQARALMRRGLDRLPSSLAQIAVTPDTRVTALIYEFRSEGFEAVTRLEMPGRHSGRVHLDRAGLWNFAER